MPIYITALLILALVLNGASVILATSVWALALHFCLGATCGFSIGLLWGLHLARN